MGNNMDVFNAAKSEYKTTTQHDVLDLQREAKRAVTETDDMEELKRKFEAKCREQKRKSSTRN
jgi:hypothetical protein